MSLSMYASPNWNTNSQTGGTQAQLNYMQGQAAQNLRNAQANLATGGPAAQSMFQYAQAKQNMMNGFNVNNAQSINWGNGPLAGGLAGSSTGGLTAGGGSFGGAEPTQQAASGWGTGNNGAPTSGVGYNNNSSGQFQNPGSYNGSYNQAVANGIGLVQQPGVTPGIGQLAMNPYGGGQTPFMGQNGWQMPNGAPMGGNGGPTSNAIPALNSTSNVQYAGGNGSNYANGMTTTWGPGAGTGGSTGASGSSSGSFGGGDYE